MTTSITPSRGVDVTAPIRVLTTYRPRDAVASTAAVLGDLVAVELLPDDYTPRLGPDENSAIR